MLKPLKSLNKLDIIFFVTTVLLLFLLNIIHIDQKPNNQSI
jgi:hypothetical protein